jgi:hypothetical protein
MNFGLGIFGLAVVTLWAQSADEKAVQAELAVIKGKWLVVRDEVVRLISAIVPAAAVHFFRF